MHTSCGFSYVASVTDVFTREILAYVVDTRATKSLVIRALRQALAIRQRQDPYFDSAGVIHHSDAGSQYTSTDLRRLLAVHQMDGSIGTVGDAYDNGLMESTIGLYKSELIDFEAETWTNWGGGGTRHSRMGPLVQSRAVAFLARAYPADQALHQLPTRKPRRPSRRVTRHSQKVRPIHNTSRRMLFDEFERGVLGELPTTPWQHTEWKRANIAPNFHITVNTARYLSALPARRPDCRCAYHWQ